MMKKELEEIYENAKVNKSIVLTIKIDDELCFIRVAKTKEELIQNINENPEWKYCTKEESYAAACNDLFMEYLEDFSDPYFNKDSKNDSDFTEIEVKDKFQKMLTYDEICKDLNIDDFIEGIYEGGELILPINLPESSKSEKLENIYFSNKELVESDFFDDENLDNEGYYDKNLDGDDDGEMRNCKVTIEIEQFN